MQQFYDIGADFIKVYEGLTPDVYLAIADESRRLGIPFAGHVPVAVEVEDASDAGQKSVEHLTGVELALSSDRQAIRERLLPPHHRRTPRPASVRKPCWTSWTCRPA